MNRESFYTSLFEPRAIAFIGALTNPAKWGFNILDHLIRGEYCGNIYPVNPQGGSWFGRPIYQRLADVPGPVDLAVIVVPKENVSRTLRECIAADIHAAVIITAGFGETGPEGRALEQEVFLEQAESGRSGCSGKGIDDHRFHSGVACPRGHGRHRASGTGIHDEPCQAVAGIRRSAG